LTTAFGKDIIYWIDTKTYFITQTAQKTDEGFGGGKGNKASTEIITAFSDYSAVEGIQFAHTIETKSPDGNGGGAVTFDKITINQPIDPKLYNPE
jgi:hypothetical protein